MRYGRWIYALLGFLIGYGHDLRIENLSMDQAAKRVSFRVSWRDAWRGIAPVNNWDGVWIFVKFRECNKLDDPWEHGLISTELSDHSFSDGIEPVLSDGSGVGVDGAPHNTGVMLRPSQPGWYEFFGPHEVSLLVENLPTSGSYEVSVFGIEMVFIPSGAYMLGSLNGGATDHGGAAYAFDQNGNGGDPHVAYTISSENAISLRWAGSGGTAINVPAGFPKGFKAFHVMKYEITQRQYADFLNTLPRNVASMRYVGEFGNFRNRLWNVGNYPEVYFSDRGDRAQNYLSWHDLCAYLDWAALRPLTEMEYEKACRGPLPELRGEYAWGSTVIVAGTHLSVVPEDGTEVFSAPANANCTFNDVTFVGGDGGRGPVRVGIHAKGANLSREASGASYYGVMDLSGNLWEMVVMVSDAAGNIGSPSYVGSWGDGKLNWTTGQANQSDWPLGNPAGFGFRGGSWGNDWRYQRVSARAACYPGHGSSNNRNPNTRHSHYGGRGAR